MEIKSFSQRLTQPYSGQIQIVEAENIRAITLDGENWEFQFIHTSNTNRVNGRKKKNITHAVKLNRSKINEIANGYNQAEQEFDHRIIELSPFICEADLPLPAADIYEYWLLDPKDGSPLALLYSCVNAEEQSTSSSLPEWIALPSSLMPIEKTDKEIEGNELPVNYRLEQCVMNRSGYKPRAHWFTRQDNQNDDFPPYLISEDWEDQECSQLCQRYLQRQSARLLMLHGLKHKERKRLEVLAQSYTLEVEKFHPMYPEIADEKLMNSMLVEARIRGANGEKMYTLKTF